MANLARAPSPSPPPRDIVRERERRRALRATALQTPLSSVPPLHVRRRRAHLPLACGSSRRCRRGRGRGEAAGPGNGRAPRDGLRLGRAPQPGWVVPGPAACQPEGSRRREAGFWAPSLTRPGANRRALAPPPTPGQPMGRGAEAGGGGSSASVWSKDRPSEAARRPGGNGRLGAVSPGGRASGARGGERGWSRGAAVGRGSGRRSVPRPPGNIARTPLPHGRHFPERASAVGVRAAAAAAAAGGSVELVSGCPGVGAGGRPGWERRWNAGVPPRPGPRWNGSRRFVSSERAGGGGRCGGRARGPACWVGGGGGLARAAPPSRT